MYLAGHLTGSLTGRELVGVNLRQRHSMTIRLFTLCVPGSELRKLATPFSAVAMKLGVWPSVATSNIRDHLRARREARGIEFEKRQRQRLVLHLSVLVLTRRYPKLVFRMNGRSNYPEMPLPIAPALLSALVQASLQGLGLARPHPCSL